MNAGDTYIYYYGEHPSWDGQRVIITTPPSPSGLVRFFRESDGVTGAASEQFLLPECKKQGLNYEDIIL